jgi:integrase
VDGDEAAALRAQIAALTAAVQALGAKTTAAPVDLSATFGKVAERYAPRVGVKIMYTLAKFLLYFGDKPVATTRKAEYLHWRDQLRAKEKTCFDRPPSVGTLNQELRQCLAMMRWAVAVEMIDKNPFDGIKFLKGQRTRETEIDPGEDSTAFVGAPLIVRVYQGICAETGARNGCEVRMIERSHIDRARRMIKFPRVNTKGKVMTRDVPISRELMDLIDEMPVLLGNPFLFASPRVKGRPYTYPAMHRLCRPFLDKLTPAPGDERVVTHDRRHTRVSRLARAGMNAMASMKLVGHKTPSMHWRYLHVSDADRDRMRAILEAERT